VTPQLYSKTVRFSKYLISRDSIILVSEESIEILEIMNSVVLSFYVNAASFPKSLEFR